MSSAIVPLSKVPCSSAYGRFYRDFIIEDFLVKIGIGVRALILLKM
jgi:hypothetical protein